MCHGADGCGHDVVPGCWLTTSRINLTAQASGTLKGHSVQCGPVRCQQIGEGILIIPGDGSYRSISGQTTYDDGSTVTLPDEIGTLRSIRGGKLRLRVSNRPELLQALRKCHGHRLSIAHQQWIKLSGDGTELTGRGRTRVTIFDSLPLQETVVSRMTGRLGTFPEPLVLAPSARVCQAPLRLQCFER